jgi:hypothetical protein
MVVGGVALGGYVWASWPEAETRVVRLPYGEALPKRVVVVPVERPAAPVAEPLEEVAEVAEVVELPAEEPVRVVAAVAPETPAEEPAPTRAPVYLAPKPVASETEDDGYVETAEELGAEPLPGEGAVTEPQQSGAK